MKYSESNSALESKNFVGGTLKQVALKSYLSLNKSTLNVSRISASKYSFAYLRTTLKTFSSTQRVTSPKYLIPCTSSQSKPSTLMTKSIIGKKVKNKVMGNKKTLIKKAQKLTFHSPDAVDKCVMIKHAGMILISQQDYDVRKMLEGKKSIRNIKGDISTFTNTSDKFDFKGSLLQ